LDDVRCKAMIDKLIIEMPLVEAIQLSPTIRKYVKTMVTKNLTNECSVIMILEQGSDIIQERIPRKLLDPKCERKFMCVIHVKNYTAKFVR